MRNLFIEFRELLAPGVLMVGVVTATDAAGVTVQLPGGGIVRARGQASVGDHVFVRDGNFMAAKVAEIRAYHERKRNARARGDESAAGQSGSGRE